MIVNKKKQLKEAEGVNNGSVGVSLNSMDRSINLYQSHPSETISLHEFHQIALNRLQALRKIEFM